VAKVNVDTELRAAFLGALSEAIPELLGSADVATALGRARDAVRGVVLHEIVALSGASPDPGMTEP
jgi:fructose/tagatose bisphosphate aldolase